MYINRSICQLATLYIILLLKVRPQSPCRKALLWVVQVMGCSCGMKNRLKAQTDEGRSSEHVPELVCPGMDSEPKFPPPGT